MTGQPVPTEIAIIYLMIATSASDNTMRDEEMAKIGQIVRTAPVFAGFNMELLVQTSRDCAAILAEQDGFNALLGLVKAAIPKRLVETAYMLACDVAAADARYSLEEQRVLELAREALGLDRLVAAALQRAAAVRSLRV